MLCWPCASCGSCTWVGATFSASDHENMLLICHLSPSSQTTSAGDILHTRCSFRG
jgi:hypothetical protein